jgi:hypothetical protein
LTETNRPKKAIRLDDWEECVGELESIATDNGDLVLGLSSNGDGELRYPENSREARIIRKHLQNVRGGTRVSILRTDMIDRPIFVKIILRDI